MNTPIVDFVRKYATSESVRLHMPGHKGNVLIGPEKYDITEIDGADVLYSAEGIIKESESNASKLFSSYKTYYSVEGSSLCIKAMLAMVLSDRINKSRKPFILAARNAHKAFIYSAVLLDFDVDWLYPDLFEHICSCNITADDVTNKLSAMEVLPDAVYVTSPDYLGNILDIESIAKVCDSFNVPLLVDNAHGAYLRFLDESIHPINLGAYMCCDSAHKTLPVLTGGAYLHLSEKAAMLTNKAESMLSLFASTSPSYMILQSLDICNSYLSDTVSERLEHVAGLVENAKKELIGIGYVLSGNEPLKLTVDIIKSGLNKDEILSALRKFNIVPEYYDNDYIVFMFSTESSEKDSKTLVKALSSLKLSTSQPNIKTAEKRCYGKNAMSIRAAFFSDKEKVPVSDAVGKICADVSVGCPPAIPVTVCGEIITEDAVDIMLSAGINKIEIVAE